MSGQALEVKTPVGDFVNEPFTDFAVPANRQRMEAALKKVAGELGREYDLIIGGERKGRWHQLLFVHLSWLSFHLRVAGRLLMR